MSVPTPATADLQQLIIVEVGDAPDKRLVRNMALLWSLYAGAADQRTRYLQARRHAIVMVMGAVRELVDINAGGEVNVTHSQRIGNLQTMLEATDAELEAVGVGTAGGTGAATFDLESVSVYPVWIANYNVPSADPETEFIPQ